MEIDKRYMARALQLARLGRGFTSPNPMVGAVIVDSSGRIIGEGYHRKYGGPHAEVNAVNSVADKSLLRESTIYVTLEPCSHYGKTPPCAKLLIDCGMRRVVIGCGDPNERVSGRGVRMLREAGIEVTEGVMERECRQLNKRFMTAHALRRPYVLLKWAQSANGMLDAVRTTDSASQLKISTPLTFQLMHRLRSDYDAILVGAQTVLADNPSLCVRLVNGRNPKRVVLDGRGRVPSDARVFGSAEPVIYFTCRHRSDLPEGVEQIVSPEPPTPAEVTHRLFELGITSVMVEGGVEVLKAFIASGVWDEARIEVSDAVVGPDGKGPVGLPEGEISSRRIDGNIIINVKNPSNIVK